MALGAIVKAGKFFDKKDKNQGKYTVGQKSLPSKNVSKPKNSLVKVLNKSSSGTSFSDGNSEATTRTRRKGGKQTDLVGVAKSIEEKVIKIDSILKDSYAFKRKQSSEEVRRKRSSKLEKAEEDLEKKAPSNFKSKIKLPTGGGKGLGILGFIKNFIFWTFIGWMYKKIIPFIPTILKVLSKITQVALSALEIFGGIADVLTKFVAGGIRLVNGLTKTLAVITGARTEQEIEKFTEKFNMVMDLALLAAMLAGDAGFSVLDLFKKKKGRDAAGKVVQKAGGVFRRGLGRAPQRIAAKVAGKKGATIVKGLTTGAKDLGNKATGNIFRRGAGKATQRLAIKLGGKAGGQALAGTSKFLGKAAGPIGTVIGAGFEFAGRKSQGQSNLQAGAGTGASVAGALAGGAAGAKGGAVAGAAIGALFGGVGAVPGAAIGGFIGGIAGAIGGGWLAGKAADKVTGADKVGQPKENTVPGKYRGGIVGKYEKGGIVDSEKPRKKKIQDTVIGKDVGGLPGMSLLFSGGKTSKSSSNEDSEDSKESKSESNWWNPFSWGKSEQEDIERGQPTKNAKKPPGLESLEETSKFLKKIPFVGELMGVSVDIAMGQKPDKPVYKSIAEKIIYIGRSMTNVDKVSEISDRSNDIQQFKRGGLSSIQSPFLSPVEKANEELESTLSLIIEKGANDALMDIRERILQEQIKARRQSNQQSNQEPGSTSGPESRDRDPNARGGYDPRYDQPPSGGGGGTTPSPSGGGGTTPSPSGGGSVDSFAISMIKVHEGSNIVGGRHKAYKDSKGYWTIGYGHLIKPGDGYNSSSVISQEEADRLFQKDYDYHKKAAMKIPGYAQASPQQQAALIDLTFNMGPSWYQGFPKFTEAFSRKNYTAAQSELRNSAWYGQVGRRAEPIVSLIGNKGIPRSAGHLAGISVPSSGNQAQTSTPSGGGRRPPTAQTRGGGTRPSTSSAGKVFHPETGGGYSGGQTDQSGRPIVLSKYGADAFIRMVQDSGMNLGASVASSGRSEAKNTKVGGDPNSHHMYGEALDMNGPGYEWVRKHGSKYGWQYGYNHSPGSAHFKYVGPGAGVPPKLAQSQKELQGYAFHGGLIVKEGVYKLHDGEFIIDKDSVNLLGADFYKALNSIENKVSLMKMSEDLIKRINEATKGKAYTPSETDYHPKGEGQRGKKEDNAGAEETTKNLSEAASGESKDIKTKDTDEDKGSDKQKDNDVQVVPASHSKTGSGFTIKGLTDEQGRPAIFSKGAAKAFGKMMEDSDNVVKGSDIASSQRSKSWNKAVGGVPNSNHLFGNALDIHGSSQTWMRQKGRKYGWVINDYPGSHGGHFDYKGKDSTGGGGDPTGQDSGGSSSGSGGGGGSTGGGGGSMGGGSGGSSGGGMSSPRDRDPSARGGYDPRYDRKEQEIEATPTQPLIPGGTTPKGYKPGSPGSFTTGKGEIDHNSIQRFIMNNEGSVKDASGNHTRYKDSRGFWTIGYGHLWKPGDPLTMSESEAAKLFEKDYISHRKAAEKIPGFSKASAAQQAALIDLTFNMGPAWYKEWPKFTAAMERGDYEEAQAQLKDSAWFKQVGIRAPKVIDMIGRKGSPGGPPRNENLPGTKGSPGYPGDVEADQQIAGDTKGKYGRIGIPNTDGQDTGADIELFGKRGEIGKTFGDNSKEGPYGNRGVEISFPYDLIYLEKVPGGRNKGYKSIDVQGSTSRDYKAVTGSTGFGHVGSYYYKDPNTGKMFEVMMGHGNKPFKKFKEGETIKAGTVVGWQGASGSSDSMQGGVYDHVTFHVNAVDGGDPGPIFNMFVDSLVSGKGAKLTAKQREEQKKEAEIAKNRPKGSESVIAGKPVVWDGKDWKPKPKDTSLLATTVNVLGKVGNSLMNAIIPGASAAQKPATKPAAQKPATKPATKPERSWYDPRGWIGKEGGGLIGKPNVKTSAINNVSQFSSYEEPGGGNIVMIQEIEVIKYVTKNKPSSPSVSGGGEKKTSDKSYMLRRQ